MACAIRALRAVDFCFQFPTETIGQLKLSYKIFNYIFKRSSNTHLNNRATTCFTKQTKQLQFGYFLVGFTRNMIKTYFIKNIFMLSVLYIFMLNFFCFNLNWKC